MRINQLSSLSIKMRRASGTGRNFSRKVGYCPFRFDALSALSAPHHRHLRRRHRAVVPKHSVTEVGLSRYRKSNRFSIPLTASTISIAFALAHKVGVLRPQRRINPFASQQGSLEQPVIGLPFYLKGQQVQLFAKWTYKNLPQLSTFLPQSNIRINPRISSI